MVYLTTRCSCDESVGGAMRTAMRCVSGDAALEVGWSQPGDSLGFSVGLTQSVETLWLIGYAGRSDYAAIGNVTSPGGHVVRRGGAMTGANDREVRCCTRHDCRFRAVGALDVKSFSRAVRTFVIHSRTSTEVSS
jgi:hypothetical protein